MAIEEKLTSIFASFVEGLWVRGIAKPEIVDGTIDFSNEYNPCHWIKIPTNMVEDYVIHGNGFCIDQTSKQIEGIDITLLLKVSKNKEVAALSSLIKSMHKKKSACNCLTTDNYCYAECPAILQDGSKCGRPCGFYSGHSGSHKCTGSPYSHSW